MISYRDVMNGFRLLTIEPDRPVIAHVSLSSFGEVRGGADTILGAMLTAFQHVMMPAFTYKTMLVPEEGPEDNGILYGTGKDTNRMTEFFTPDMPADPMMGVTAEKLRSMPHARRSDHPILSFTGIGVDEALKSQTIDEPLAPIGVLSRQDGWVLLVGVDQTANTSIHYAERQAGRKHFTRWALTADGVKVCPGFPGCSDGFNALEHQLSGITRSVRIGGARVQAISLPALIETVRIVLEADPLALLCGREHCDRCDAVRHSISAPYN